jgi:hypothetical protein
MEHKTENSQPQINSRESKQHLELRLQEIHFWENRMQLACAIARKKVSRGRGKNFARQTSYSFNFEPCQFRIAEIFG